jgi:hypothetical protein
MSDDPRALIPDYSWTDYLCRHCGRGIVGRVRDKIRSRRRPVGRRRKQPVVHVPQPVWSAARSFPSSDAPARPVRDGVVSEHGGFVNATANPHADVTISRSVTRHHSQNWEANPIALHDVLA